MLEQASSRPRAFVADGFITPRETARVLARYDAGEPIAGVEWNRSVAGTSAELPLGADPRLAAIAARIEAALGFECSLPDPTFRFRRYAPGDHHPLHVDCYEIAGHFLVATALVYLTDALAGGETTFPDADAGPLVITPRAGRLALWFNYTPDGEVDLRSRHRSEPLISGEKATLAYFVYAPLGCAAITPPATTASRWRVRELACA